MGKEAKPKVVAKVSDLTGDAAKVGAVVTAYAPYRKAVNEDELSTATDDAKIADAHVFYKDTAVIVILPERHASDDAKVRSGADAVATKVMLIPNVKVAVEEPIAYNNTFLSIVGFNKDVSKKPTSQSLWVFEETSKGSIAHQLYEKQNGHMGTTSRYAAEKIPRSADRYTNPRGTNATMVDKLVAGTGHGEVSVFPVGSDHLSTGYHRDTLRVLLEAKGWKLLTNN